MTEYEYIRDVLVPSMPDKVDADGNPDENGSPSLMKKVMSTPCLALRLCKDYLIWVLQLMWVLLLTMML